ncbi:MULTISPECIES: glycerol-3-phosphate dehydrogenase [Cyanophyceae]|uniref:glycerol-3-phosphate dehydrogenase n=1 Tax=Cyanophyceae TaxID=3028117 RepID=UPI0016864D21|nr:MULTISPECIES: glycerol-3-phosphate dehydrogenase [Cyanophyceae]MBD1919405.1 glycerol-3-phosphate dehydrogenase [Phormidium sp. FACHB-77]MBD2051912.1 glycerol-3-phosphate dehydrogenase [Leptolyngbya sp. FACHB-60]
MPDLQAIHSTVYDLIVIGGGINGAGVARDGALRGLKTLLIEKGDFGGGTTSWSSRLIHGGLRYLEYFEFKLVRESLREREILLKTAPHLVQPIQMTIPIYGSGSRSYWEIQAGMILYDMLSFDKTLPPHRMLSPQKVAQLFRAANRDNLKGAAQFYDGQVVYAERLCLETLLSAQAAGATVLNYAQVVDLQVTSNRITGLTGQMVHSGERFTVESHEQTMVVNTAGPWVDEVLGLGKGIRADRKIGGTKGSHIIVDPFPGAPATAFYAEAAADGRPFFILPWQRQYLIGTTDHRYDRELDHIKADNAEIDYLLAETNHIFPCAQLGRQDVRFTYSGVRPLPYSADEKPSSITRDHVLFDHHREGVNNLISLIGGKLTTFRQVGEEMVEAVFRKQGRTAPPSPTRHQPLPGALDLNDPHIEATMVEYRSRLPRATLYHLFTVYGRRAAEVLAWVDKHPALAEPIVPNLPDIKAQVVVAVEAEFAQTLVDICRRRTLLAMQADYGFEALPAVTETLKDYCGWSQAKCDRAVNQYCQYMEANCWADYALPSAVTVSE